MTEKRGTGRPKGSTVAERLSIPCDFCGNIMYLTASLERKRRKNSKFSTVTCSRSCSAKLELKNNPEHHKLMIDKANLALPFEVKSRMKKEEFARKLTPLSPFRVFLNGSRKKVSKDYGDLTLEYLKETWDNQKGLCGLTGVPMEIRVSTTDVRNNSRTPLYGASLDRIDSNVGYMQGNIQFVCKGANLMKNNHTNEDALLFIKMIKEATNA